MLRDLGCELSRQVGCQRVGVLEHRVNQGPELRTHRQVRHRRGKNVGSVGRSGQSDIGDLVVELDDLRLAAHPGVLLRGTH